MANIEHARRLFRELCIRMHRRILSPVVAQAIANPFREIRRKSRGTADWFENLGEVYELTALAADYFSAAFGRKTLRSRRYTR
jgi:hypothetical protein